MRGCQAASRAATLGSGAASSAARSASLRTPSASRQHLLAEVGKREQRLVRLASVGPVSGHGPVAALQALRTELQTLGPDGPGVLADRVDPPHRR